MIHSNTQIQCLSLFDGEPKYKTIDEIYQEYCHKEQVVWKGKGSEKISTIDFTDDIKLKITDSYGWTDLLYITRVPMLKPINSWVQINVADKNVIVSNCEYIPAYKITLPRIGFHGEVKYNYICKTSTNINGDDYLRLYRGRDNNGDMIEFAHITSIEEVNDEFNYGFILTTKSKFYNANRIHLFSNTGTGKEENISDYK